MCETENGHTDATSANVKKILKERGLSTQCIQGKNVSKCNPMTLAQLLLKINTKMGGINNAIVNDNRKVTRFVSVCFYTYYLHKKVLFRSDKLLKKRISTESCEYINFYPSEMSKKLWTI